jgi:AcrR family transcriptional regulator
MSDPRARLHDPQARASAEPPRARLRPGGRSARIRRAILEAAIDLLVEEGESGLRLPAVAERAGVTKKTVYRWWSTGAELLREALEDLEDRGIDLPDTGCWESDVRGFVRGLAAYLAEPRATALVRHIALARSSDAQFGAWIDAFWAERRTAFDALVQRAITRGELPEHAGELPFIALVAGPIVLHTVIGGRGLTDGEVDDLASIVAHGMRRSDEASSDLGTDP